MPTKIQRITFSRMEQVVRLNRSIHLRAIFGYKLLLIAFRLAKLDAYFEEEQRLGRAEYERKARSCHGCGQ